MSRLRQLRLAAGLTAEELGAKIGTSGVQIGRLETGKRKLTEDWIGKLAAALGVAPADLLGPQIATLATADEVEPFRVSEAGGAYDAMAKRGIAMYRVLAASVARAGVQPGTVIAIDTSTAAIAAITTGQVALVRLGADGPLLLRQFVAPALYVTNRVGANSATNADDPSSGLVVVGVILD